MPNPNTNFRNSNGTDLGNILITKDYLMSVYPQIAGQLITPELWVWGFNSFFSALGVNDLNNRTTPVTTFAGGANWKQIACGGLHTAAIKTDGTLWIWGAGSVGRLGDNTSTNRSTPVTTFSGGTNWKQIGLGNACAHSAAIKTDGTLWVWGFNPTGQLGDNTTTNRVTPITTFSGGTNWKQVSAGYRHTAAIKTDGTLWTWGRNLDGECGNNTVAQRNTPITTFAGGTNWKQVSCGRDHTVAIKTDGTLWAWGRNAYAALGDNTTTQRNTPITTFSGGTNWKQVSAGYRHTAAIKTDGTLWTWGSNAYAQMGDNTTVNRSTPVTTFGGGNTWKQVASGGRHTMATKTDGTLWVWGSNSATGSVSGQLGTNDTLNKSTPVTTFAGGNTWKQVSASNHSAAIETSDDLQGI